MGLERRVPRVASKPGFLMQASKSSTLPSSGMRAVALGYGFRGAHVFLQRCRFWLIAFRRPWFERGPLRPAPSDRRVEGARNPIHTLNYALRLRARKY
jgi:hypothetical protein